MEPSRDAEVAWQPMSAALSQFVEQMGSMWEDLGMPHIEGRIVGYLMVTNAPSTSSAELINQLQASAATISTCTRRLADIGFIRKVKQPGARGHFFRVEDDVWGAFLAGERRYLARQVALAENMLAQLGEGDDGPRRRLANMRDYMSWLTGYHRKMLNDWEQFKSDRDHRSS